MSPEVTILHFTHTIDPRIGIYAEYAIVLHSTRYRSPIEPGIILTLRELDNSVISVIVYFYIVPESHRWTSSGLAQHVQVGDTYPEVIPQGRCRARERFYRAQGYATMPLFSLHIAEVSQLQRNEDTD